MSLQNSLDSDSEGISTSRIRNSVVVADGTLSNLDINPYISTDTLLIKYKNSTGTARQVTFPVSGGLVALDSAVVHNTGTENVGGIKTFTSPTLFFEIQNPFIQNKTPVSLTTSTTITSVQIVTGPIVGNPGAGGATYTLPLGTDVDSILNAINPNRGKDILFVNQDATGSITIATNTGFNVSGCYLTGGNVVIMPLTQRRFDIVKIDNTPTYALFG